MMNKMVAVVVGAALFAGCAAKEMKSTPLTLKCLRECTKEI